MTRSRDVANIDTILTTKGDIYAASAAYTPARLGVGNNGETLVADSSATTGLRYTAGNAVGNPVINSAMQVWQRGTTFTSTNGAGLFAADRWQIYSGASGRTWSRQLTNDTTNLPFIQYCTRVQRDSGNTATNQLNMAQNFETVNSIFYAGKTITVSFYARAGANYSPTSSGLTVQVQTGTGTDQNGFYSGYTGGATPINSTVTLTTTWQRFTVTGTLASNINEMFIGFYMTPTGTAGAADFYEITGVQIDVGSVALPFRTYAATLAGEFLACCRYYQKLMDAAEQGSEMICMMRASSTTGTNGGHVQLLTPMRTAPTITMPAVSGNYYYEGGSSLSTVSTSQASPRRFRVDTTGTGLTAGQAVWLTLAGSTAQVTASAEL